MNKLKIGIIVNDSVNPTSGGGFSYEEKLIKMIDEFSFDSSIEIVFITHKSDYSFKKETLVMPFIGAKTRSSNFKLGLNRKPLPISLLKYLFFNNVLYGSIREKRRKKTETFFMDNKIDLLYYLTPFYKTYNYPFIATHWDMGHNSMFAFPEIAMNNYFEERENYHRIELKKSFAIFAESERSKEELIKYEQIYSEKIFILPLFPGRVIELNLSEQQQDVFLKNWKLQTRQYFFYPAQFWSHKNHYNLVKAFHTILKLKPELKLVLSGSDKGNKNYIKELVKELRIENSIIFTEFVSNEEIFTFYKNAIALVMPTFLGPTNMPLLEAYYIGCPILCSNLKGHMELMKERAIYFDPANYEEIAEKMMHIINNFQDNIASNIFVESEIMERLNNNLLMLHPIRKAFGYNCNQF